MLGLLRRLIARLSKAEPPWCRSCDRPMVETLGMNLDPKLSQLIAEVERQLAYDPKAERAPTA